jgi:hypothetical protein
VQHGRQDGSSGSGGARCSARGRGSSGRGRVSDGDPTWSHNGNRIAFESTRNGSLDVYTMRTAKGHREFFVMGRNGGGQKRLLAQPRLWDMSPDWGISRGRRGCTIAGTINADDLVGTPRRDVICGLGGSDRLRGLGGNDLLIGGAGADRLEGGTGYDTGSFDIKRDRFRSIERRVRG